MEKRGLLILLLAGFCVPAYNQIRKHVFVETVMSWSEAQSYCRENYIDLATVSSQEEAEQLLNIAGASFSYSWIGLYRDNTQNWQWSNSDDVIYSNWRADIFCASVNSEGKWIDLPCHLQKAFMCYKETSIITERYILNEELKTWTEAQQYCREYHTDLVSIKNAFENEEIVKKAQGNSFWIGLFNEPWKWSHQGDNYTFHSWSYGQPNNRGGDQNCVVISNTGEWTDYDCNDQYSFFCCEDSSSGQCFYEGTWKTWQEAQSYCRNQSRDLPSIQDQARVNELIGLVPSMNFSEHWIGLYHDKENWQWSSGGDVIYTNWERYLFCASVNSGGEWEDSPCSKGNYFMCYSETCNIAERYTLIEELKTWTEAQQYCREHHTDLVSIKNASENEEIVKKAQGKPFWIGLFNEPWKWSHQGENYTFHNWNYGQPNNWGGSENCVMMSNTGGWKDYDCNDQNSFFCCEDSIPTSPPSTLVSQEAEFSSPPSTPVSQDSDPTSPPSTPVSQEGESSRPPSTPDSQDKMAIARVKLNVPIGVNPEDPKVSEAILEQIREHLSKNFPMDGINLRWRKQDGEIFHKDEEEEEEEKCSKP